MQGRLQLCIMYVAYFLPDQHYQSPPLPLFLDSLLIGFPKKFSFRFFRGKYNYFATPHLFNGEFLKNTESSTTLQKQKTRQRKIP